jgi:pilus assembly protein FimV
MKRILIALAAAAGLLPASAFALGVGELTLESGLNEPFEARIALLSITREEIDSLNVGLADNEAFRRAGVDRPFVLSNLRFELVETEAGADYIRVSSADAIREPFLNFLVEISWSKGRLYREYTVLLDPPLYDTRAAPTYARRATAPAPAMAPVVEALPADADVGDADYAPAPAFTGSEYGPTEASDTLWSIAGRTRPDAGVTVQQMMLALLRANPDAFISGNVNGLRRGQILKVPDREEINAVAPDQALAEVKSQYALWDDIRGTIANAPRERPETTPATAPAVEAAPAPVAVEDTTELRLVAAADTGAGADQGGGGGGAETGQLRERLALANEQVAATAQENTELKDKLAESDAIIADLKRLIALKDDELAALQQQMAADAAAVPATPAPAEAPAAEQPAEEETDAETVPAAVPPEADAEPPAEAPAPEESGAAAPESPPATQEPAAEKPAEEKPAAQQKPAPVPAKPEPTLVDQVLEFVTGNLLIIGAAVGAIVLLIAGIAAVGRFRSRMEASAASAPVEEFPDFTLDEGEAEPASGSEDVTGVREQPERSAASPAAAPAEKEDATVFALPPEAKPKAAPAAKAAEPAPAAASSEEALDAFHHEVNVFMAYEDWDQAEHFVRDAIGREPNNLDFHAKLLEVFFTSGNRRKYEAAAKALHDVVGGTGPYWDNAVVMWNEMSPNRALFAAGGEEEEGPASTATGGGLLDLTAAASRGDAGLDFDLGEATAEPSAKPAASEDEPVLDITGAEGAASPQPAAEDGGELLDVTAAVGLEADDAALELEPAAPEEGVLDLTGGSEQPASDLLDVSGSGTDLLDVTAQTDVGAQEISDEDLLDVTSTAASARDAAEEAAPPPAEESAGEHTLDFNLEDVSVPAAPAEEPAEPSEGADNIIEFESSGGGLELATEDDSGGDSMDETSLGGGLELDMGATIAEESGGLELDLTIDDAPAAEEKASDDIDMDGTVEIPKLELVDEDEDGDDDEDGEDHTVFVPRSGDAQEQSVEDKMASQLDLAKAYVEMGTKESRETAKGILNQVLADGTEQQKRKAQDLIRSIS